MRSSSIAPLLAAIASLAAVSALACGSSSEPAPKQNVEVVKSSLARDMSPVLTPAQLDVFSQDQAEFAVDLYQAVRKDPASADKDVFVSPHSVSTALAMTFAGARGTTRDEMKKVLHYSLEDATLHRSFDYLDLALSSRGAGATAADGKPFRLKVANSIWGQKGTAFDAPFLDTLAVNYGAGLNVVDFINAREDARLAINGWVEDKTENRIKDLVPEDALNEDTRLVLVNAVYFNAAWATKFYETGTEPAPFTKLDGSVAQVPTMHLGGHLPYAKGDGYEAVELPYEGGETSMLVIAPTAGQFATFESSMTGGKVLDVMAGLASQKVNLSFPKLKLDASLSLKDPLKSLGMKQAFEGANFRGISSSIDLQIKDVLHKTFLQVDENGTEAAAATAVIVGEATSAPVGEPIAMKVDRPFVIAIVDKQTKTLVFLGRILLPKQ